MIVLYRNILCLLFFSCNVLYSTNYNAFQTDNQIMVTFILQVLLNTKESEKIDLYLKNRPNNTCTFLQKNGQTVGFLSLYPQNNQEVWYELYTRPDNTDVPQIAFNFAREIYPEAHKFTLSTEKNGLFKMTSFGNTTYFHN